MNKLLHIAIIMDGNRRWARRNKYNLLAGHEMGSNKIKQICQWSRDIGLKYLTLYAFSAQNWNRDPEEIKALMHLLENFLTQDNLNTFLKNKIHINIIGDKDIFNDKIKNGFTQILQNNRQITSPSLILNVAINYGAREEILNAVSKIISAKVEINMENFTKYLYTSGVPDPDLLIRTGGHKRLSNFLLWQMSYTELYFCDTLWPDFSNEDFLKAVDFYNSQERKFGQ